MSSRSPLQRVLWRFVSSKFPSSVAINSFKVLQPRAGTAFWATPRFSTTVKMSSIGGAGVGVGSVMYAAISTPVQRAAEPEEAKDKKHHLNGGKGFTNPWDSYAAMGAFETFRTLIWYVSATLLFEAISLSRMNQLHRTMPTTKAYDPPRL